MSPELQKLIDSEAVLPITGNIPGKWGNSDHDPIHRICECCGCGEVGTRRYIDVWGRYPPNKPGPLITWDDPGNIVFGCLKKDEPLPEFGEREHLLLESEELNFLIVWDDK